MILMIDNYDSFTYNLVQYIESIGPEVKVFRNDEITVAEIEKLDPDVIVISPGPGTPNEAGISLEVIRAFKGRVPILGICLGHQTIGQAFGGRVVTAREPVHGKVHPVTHTHRGVFKGLNNPLKVTRYHSLVLEKETLPDCLEITCETADGEIMGIRHKQYQVEGIQFHPEAILTEMGLELLRNFYSRTGGNRHDH